MLRLWWPPGQLPRKGGSSSGRSAIGPHTASQRTPASFFAGFVLGDSCVGDRRNQESRGQCRVRPPIWVGRARSHLGKLCLPPFGLFCSLLPFPPTWRVPRGTGHEALHLPWPLPGVLGHLLSYSFWWFIPRPSLWGKQRSWWTGVGQVIHGAGETPISAPSRGVQKSVPCGHSTKPRSSGLVCER